MNESPETPDPEAWGIDLTYRDTADGWHDAPPETVQRILAAMGATTRLPPGQGDDAPVLVITGARRPTVVGSWQLATEAGGVVDGHDALPLDLPLGYHHLTRHDGRKVLVIVAPEACPSTAGVHAWGWALQLYALRSQRSWGMGDLGDLADFAQLAADAGSDVVILNPLHATLVGLPQEPSPYFPSSREFRNPLYLRIEDVPGADATDVGIEDLVHQAHGLNGDELIDRNAVWRLKHDALERIWRHRRRDAEFDEFVERAGLDLEKYATFCAISETHGRSWSNWPEELRHPHSESVRRFAEEHRDRVEFHSWLQWLLDSQLGAAGDVLPLVQDLAIGVDPSGADAWLWQDALALDMRVGAPPDDFNTRGQNWLLPPFDPWRLRALGYAPFIRTVRAALRHAGGLRIDHVMGLFRLYWIPDDGKPTEGTYVRYPWEDLFAILALESRRANAYIVGEDLGTVEPYMRDELARNNVLSCRLVWFESRPPAEFPAQALATVSTHDLATIAGLWTGSDLTRQHQLGTEPNVAAMTEMKTRLARFLGLNEDAPVEAVIPLTYELLAQAPSAWVAATLDDALGVEERVNFPGTTDEWPNWRISCRVGLEDLAAHPGFRATVEALRKGRKVTSNRSQ